MHIPHIYSYMCDHAHFWHELASACGCMCCICIHKYVYFQKAKVNQSAVLDGPKILKSMVFIATNFNWNEIKSFDSNFHKISTPKGIFIWALAIKIGVFFPGFGVKSYPHLYYFMQKLSMCLQSICTMQFANIMLEKYSSNNDRYDTSFLPNSSFF